MSCDKCERSKYGKCFEHRTIKCYGCQATFSPQRPWTKFCDTCQKNKNQIGARISGAIR